MPEQYNPKKIEEHVRKQWAEKKVVERIVDFEQNLAERGRKFYLLDGPPYVNGVPHVGHVKTIVFKDIWAKLRFMQGYASWFQPGFDCGGLPIENKVEEQLGIESKQDIEEKIGVDAFIQKCKEFAEGNEPVWMNLYKDLASWKGWLKPYMTHKDYYLESGWWTVKQMYEKGLLVEGHKPGFWCSHCETVLSGYEVTDSYKDVQDPSIYIKFPVSGRKNEYIVAWTTTPWTLPANVAIVVHPDEIYVVVEALVSSRDGSDNSKKERLVMAQARMKQVMEECGIVDYRVIEKMPGKKLEGLKYEPLLDLEVQRELKNDDNAHRVYLSIPIMKKRVVSKARVKDETEESEDEFSHMVTMDSGSGCVHTAPGHGDVDNKLGKHYGLPEPSPVDEHGRLTEDTEEFAGMFVKKADKAILEKLKETGLLLHSSMITHSYPLCWRCKSPLIYRMSRQWFVKIDTLKEKMLSENRRVNWLPKFAEQRFHNFVSESPDWAVTRQRYWGIPIPIWTCDKCGTRKVIGSRRELIDNAVETLDTSIDLHKNVVDKVHLRCGCGSLMSRDPNIMDVWFDSGIAPWASLGYPYKNKELFEKLWSVDLVDESQDQIRGWFYTLMFASVATFGERPYDTVCLNGWTLDEHGEKMSKSLGNVMYAEDGYKEFGADLFRFCFCYDIAPWETQKFSLREAKKLDRLFNVLWNSYQFAKTYCIADNYQLMPEMDKLETEDMWILSRLNRLIKSTTENLEAFKLHLAGRELMSFIVDDFSRTYIKLVRDRVLPGGRRKEAADFCMYEVLNKVSLLLAPIAPYMSDYIFTDLFGKSEEKESVHLEKWPEHDKSMLNERLEQTFATALAVVAQMNSVRQEAGIKLRWPLSKVKIDCKADLKPVMEAIKLLGNVKKVELEELENGNEFQLNKQPVRFVLDISLDKKLEEEALLRELLREVQNHRKKMKLVIKDRIDLIIDGPASLKRYADEIKTEVGSKTISFESLEHKKHEKFEFKGSVVRFSVSKSR